ncbi:CLUMA_CG012452, isoform A [Clunio marinus]|uniref:CLUMA_CG012452, isoform A n=1 Tax=Clunio marinus TaxID=568069 RepID=A0A1J1IHY4_9DIPT|nr:CLUMA_CG012452, isoform A [Clunio marinus]
MKHEGRKKEYFMSILKLLKAMSWKWYQSDSSIKKHFHNDDVGLLWKKNGEERMKKSHKNKK